MTQQFAALNPLQASSSEQGLPLIIAKKNDRFETSPAARTNFTKAVLAAIATSILGICFGFRSYLFQPKPADVDQVHTPVHQQSIFALGRIEPEGEVIAVAGPSGANDARIELLHVEVGDLVRKGDALATLDNYGRLQAALNLAQATVEQAQWQLAQARVVATVNRAELLATLEAQKAYLQNAKVELSRLRGLLHSQAVSNQEFNSAQLSVDTLEKKVREVEAKLARYKDDNESNIDVLVAKSNVQVAEASLQQAKINLSQSVVLAPSDGVILEINLRPGERLGQTELLKMCQSDSMIIRAEVYESEIAKLDVGLQVSAFSTALPDRLTGSLVRIGRYIKKQANTEATPAANTNARVIDAWIKLDARSSNIASKYINLQVRAEILK